MLYGYTDNCEGCKRAGADAEPRPHTAACRERINREILRYDQERARMLRSVKRLRSKLNEEPDAAKDELLVAAESVGGLTVYTSGAAATRLFDAVPE